MTIYAVDLSQLTVREMRHALDVEKDMPFAAPEVQREEFKRRVAEGLPRYEIGGGVRDPSPPEPCEKCDSVHADWLDTPYPHSIQNPLPTCREAGFKHKPDPMDALEIQKQFAGHRWVVGYMPIEENPWGVHGPMDDGREHVYPIAWLSTRQQAESVAYTLEAYAGVRGAGVVPPEEPK